MTPLDIPDFTTDTYLLDTNVFIDASKRYYHPNIVPGFWTWLEDAHRGKCSYSLISIEKVYGELTAKEKGDDVAKWAKNHKTLFVKILDDEMNSETFKKLSAWAQEKTPKKQEARKFLEAADYLLVGYAAIHKYTVVTLETSFNKSPKIHIPDACSNMGVRCINTFEMLREQRVMFK